MRRQVNRIMVLDLRKRICTSNPRSRPRTEPTYNAAELPQKLRTSKCKSNASDVVFTTKGSRRVLVCKRTCHQAPCGTLHHRSSHVGRGLSGSPYAQATAGGRSARMWQDRAGLRSSRGGQYGG